MKKLISIILIFLIFSSCKQAPTSNTQSVWKPYSAQALAASLAAKKPFVIDFYADWCPVCHELDETVFSRADIQAKLAQVTALRVDATNQDDPEIQKILQEYDVDGLPTIVFFNAHGEEISNSRVIGLVTPEEFSQSLALLKIFK